MATAADTKPPRTSLAGDDPFIAIFFGLGAPDKPRSGAYPSGFLDCQEARTSCKRLRQSAPRGLGASSHSSATRGRGALKVSRLETTMVGRRPPRDASHAVGINRLPSGFRRPA